MTRQERNEKERELAEQLIAVELAYNKTCKEPYHSDHEAYAVVREEYKEARADIRNAKWELERIDTIVRGVCVDDDPDIITALDWLDTYATRAIIECAHIAAAGTKWYHALMEDSDR